MLVSPTPITFFLVVTLTSVTNSKLLNMITNVKDKRFALFSVHFSLFKLKANIVGAHQNLNGSRQSRLRDPRFSRLCRTPTCDRQTDTR